MSSLGGGIQGVALGKAICIQSAVETALAGRSVESHEDGKVLYVGRYVGNYTGSTEEIRIIQDIGDGPGIVERGTRRIIQRRCYRLVLRFEIGRALPVAACSLVWEILIGYAHFHV